MYARGIFERIAYKKSALGKMHKNLERKPMHSYKMSEPFTATDFNEVLKLGNKSEFGTRKEYMLNPNF